MIDKDKIQKSAVSIENKSNCAVYVLISGEEIVYVGKSTNPILRIAMHIKDKTFDKYTILTCHDFDMEEQEFQHMYSIIEEELIMKFLPRYNKSIDDLIYTTPALIKHNYGVGKRELSKIVKAYNIKHKVFNGCVYYLIADIIRAINGFEQ